MLYRIEAGLFPHLDDTIGRKTAASIREALGIPVKSVRTIKVFTLEGLDAQQVNTLMAKSVLHDPVLQAVSLSPLPLPEEGTSWIIEVGYRPGVTDNEGRTARDTAALVLGIEDRSSLAVYTSIQYRLHGPLTEEQVTRIARDLLANELIQRFEIKSRAQWDADPGFAPKAARVTGASCDEVNIVPLSSMSDAQLMEVSQKNTLALSLEEMTKIKNWFSSPEVAAQRKELGLPADPTDAELEVLAQTWSEHCKHKIFASKISYTDKEAGTSETINSLYKTCIMNTTKQIRESLGDRDFCRSVFKDNAGVIRPILESEAGLVISHGICPKYSDYDAYWMMANAMDEGIRNAVAVGADPDRMAGVDNFCWCDPVQSEKTPDGEYKLAQLVRACKALSELCVAYGVPCISGKDSMKNDYTGGGKKISIPPTVLFSVLGIMDDVKKAVTSDFKKPGDRLYIIGNTARELAGSEIADQLGIACNTVPRVDAKSALASYRKLHQAINSRLISACHDLSDGGLAVSLAEMCIGGRLGAHLALNRVPVIGALTLTEALYSESASRLLVSVAPDKAAEFEALFGASEPFIGEVTSDTRLTVASADSALFSAPVEALAHAFKATLDW